MCFPKLLHFLSGTLLQVLQAPWTEQCLEEPLRAETVGDWAGMILLTTQIHTSWGCNPNCGLGWSQLKKKFIFIIEINACGQEMSSHSSPSTHQADPYSNMKAREVDSQASACCGSDCHWLLHFPNMIILYPGVGCWQPFFHCCCWRTRTMGSKLEVQGKSVMLCLNIILKWNITWHNVIRKQIWLPRHLYPVQTEMGPWRNRILYCVYTLLNILLQYGKFKGAFVVNENHILRIFCWWFSSAFSPLLNFWECSMQSYATYSWLS